MVLRTLIRFIVCLGEEETEAPPNNTKTDKIQKRLKGHLNGLYNGLSKIMLTTCQINANNSSAPFSVEKAIHNITFIKHHMKRQDEFDAVSLRK